MPEPLCLFDGACVLCDGTVRFWLRHERDDALSFCAVQSPRGQALLAALGLPAMPDSYLLVDDGRVFLRSAAGFRMARHLKAPWRWVRLFAVLPRAVTDWVYDRVANNRYRIFGQKETCLVPVPAQRHRFLA